MGLVILMACLMVESKVSAADGVLDSFMGSPELDVQQIFQSQRFPNITVAMDGSVLASWGSKGVQVRRSVDGGESWSSPVVVQESGFQGGGITVDEKTGDVLMFVEDSHPPAPISIYRSNN